MKKILVLFLFLLVSCSNDRLEIIEVDRHHYPLAFDSTPIGISETGLYYIKGEILYYKDNKEDTIPLGSINYVNGEQVDLLSESNSNIREDRFGGRDLICYGDRIYMLYHTDEFGKNLYYQLASVDLKGEDFKTHIVFDYMPQEIKINNGKVYVTYIDYENNNQNYIEIYNQNFELESTKYYDYINDFYTENGELVVVEEDYVLYDSDKIKIKNNMEWIDADTYKGTGIIQIEDKQFILDDKVVQFVTDEYFYVSSELYPQTYERYYLNGELDKSIVINEYIENAGGFVSFPYSDFSYMQLLKDEDIVYGYSNSANPKIFEVNFEKGTCNYIDK